jgi:hypothetical protein
MSVTVVPVAEMQLGSTTAQPVKLQMSVCQPVLRQIWLPQPVLVAPATSLSVPQVLFQDSVVPVVPRELGELRVAQEAPVQLRDLV